MIDEKIKAFSTRCKRVNRAIEIKRKKCYNQSCGKTEK
jgi:hypothetical protein